MKKRIIDSLIVLTLLALMTPAAMANGGLVKVPDVGSTSALMCMALAGLATLRRYMR